MKMTRQKNPFFQVMKVCRILLVLCKQLVQYIYIYIYIYMYVCMCVHQLLRLMCHKICSLFFLIL